MSSAWRWFVPGYIWSAPHTFIGLVLILLYIPRSIRWSDGCLEVIPRWIIGSPGAQTHGCVIFYANERARGSGELRVHERVHVVQGFIGGPFFVLSYVVLFLAKFASQGFRDWWRAYMWSPYERHAYRVDDQWTRGKRPGAWGEK